MARPLRLEFEGAWYHVMNRGAAHQNIFRTKEQRNIFLNLLREASLYFNIECHAYCLMDNHYHLLIHTPQANLSQAMRHINGIYTQKYNRSENIDGPLFRGRYKAILVEEDSYLVHVSRYIHLNPLEAKITKKLIEYEWSSYRYYVDIDKTSPHPWLHTNMILGMLGKKNNRNLYRDFVNEGVDEATQQFYAKKNQPSILGSSIYKTQKLEEISPQKLRAALPDYNRTRMPPSLIQIKNLCSSYFKVKEETLLFYQLGKENMPRRVAMYLCRVVGQSRLEEIAKYFNCKTKSGASNAVCKVKRDLATDAKLIKKIKQLIEILEKSN